MVDEMNKDLKRYIANQILNKEDDKALNHMLLERCCNESICMANQNKCEISQALISRGYKEESPTCIDFIENMMLKKTEEM